MMDLPYDQTETVQDVEYRQIVDTDEQGSVVGQRDVLFVRTDGRDFTINNTGFTASNFALQFLAFCGARPSDTDAAQGTVVPLVDTEHGYFPPDWVFEKGKQALAQSEWGPVVTEVPLQ